MTDNEKFYQLGRVRNGVISTEFKIDNVIVANVLEEEIFNYAILAFVNYMEDENRKKDPSLRSKDYINNKINRDMLFHNVTDTSAKNALQENIFGFCLFRKYQDIKPFDMYYDYLEDFEKYKVNKYLNINFLEFLDLPFHRVNGILEFTNRLLTKELAITNKHTKILEKQHNNILNMRGMK